MTEKEYSTISDLATTRSAKAVLHNVAPECCSNAISNDEYVQVMKILSGWEEKLNKIIED